MKTQVWDPFVRVFHWATATLFLANYWLIEDGPVHRWLGYGVAGLVIARTLWGVFGSPHARFGDFVPTLAQVLAHVRSIVRGEHPSSVGHNPLGALMIIALLVLLAALCLTGWTMGLDVFWGVEWLEEAHEAIATLIQGLVLIHVAAVLAADILYREGLIRAMVTGYKEIGDSQAVNR
jgi:cytochrome b